MRCRTGVPLEIRQISRPKNTVVDDNKRVGPFQYAVRERKCVIYVPGENPKPRNGRVIGHIYNGIFVPIKDKIPEDKVKPTILSYGAVALAKKLSNDIFDDLVKVFPLDKAYAIMVIAILKVVRPTVTISRMATQYKKSFLSEFYLGTHLSKNYVSLLFDVLGQDLKLLRQFYKLRIDNVRKEHHIAIDGTLKQNNSVVNDLSHFSYKSRVKGTKDISVLYAYDVELKEPICAPVYPGNSLVTVSYKKFV